MLIHRSSVLGLELVIATNSLDSIQVVRDFEPGVPGQRLVDGSLEIEIVSEGATWTLFSGGRAIRSVSCNSAVAAQLQDIVTDLICDRLPDFTKIPADLVTLSGLHVLIVGEEAGTSALTLALLARGAELHTGHLVLLKDGECIPFPRRLRVFDTVQRLATQDAALPEPRRYSAAGGLFRFFDPTDIGLPWRLDCCVPSVIVHLEPGGEVRPEVAPQRGIVMVQNLLSVVTDLPRQPQKTIAAISSLVAGCTCLRVTSGGRPDASAQALHRLLVADREENLAEGSKMVREFGTQPSLRAGECNDIEKERMTQGIVDEARATPRWMRRHDDSALYRRRILNSPPVECGNETDFEVHLLTCHRDLLDALWCLKSFCHFSDIRPALVFHDDGTLGASDFETLLQHFPGCRIARRAHADAELAEFLTAYPHCLKFRSRKDFHCALKFFDSFYYARADKILLLDSDLLFFRRPVELLQHIATDRPCFLRDYQDAYAMPRGALETTFRMAIEPLVNAGLMFLQRRQYTDNIDFIENYFATPTAGAADDVNRHEQTLQALLLSKCGAVPLSAGYQISNRAAITDDTVVHHAVSDGSRADMQAAGLRRLEAAGFLEALDLDAGELRAKLSARPPIIIAAACDLQYAPSLTVMLRSLLANAAGARRFIVYVLSDGLRPAVRETICNSLRDPRAEIRFVEIDRRSLDNLKLSHHASSAVYDRLLVHTAVPEQIERLIYLDSDLIVNADLQALWEMDFHGKALLAVQEQCRDAQTVSAAGALPNYRELGLPPDAKYFNSGVMLINLKKWRDTDVSGRALAYLRTYRENVLWWDQDALNAVLAGDWGELDHRWNLLTQSFTNPRWDDGPVKDRRAYETLIRHPYILHFNTGSKPWHRDNRHPRRELFFHYLSLTRWAGRWPSLYPKDVGPVQNGSHNSIVDQMHNNSS